MAPPINVDTASGTRYSSSVSCILHLHILPKQGGHIIPGFQHNLVGIGTLYNRGCKVIYDKHAVHILDDTSKVLLKGWRETTGARLWRFYLQSGRHQQFPNNSTPATPPPPPTHAANKANEMPSVQAPVRFLQAAAGYPVKSTWLSAIRSGNYKTWPGITYENAKTYHPTITETLKGNMKQTRQGVRSTKKKTTMSKPTRSVSPLSINVPSKMSN